MGSHARCASKVLLGGMATMGLVCVEFDTYTQINHLVCFSSERKVLKLHCEAK